MQEIPLFFIGGKSKLSLVEEAGHLVVEGCLHELGVISPSFGEAVLNNESLPVSLHAGELSEEETIGKGVEHIEALGEVEVKPSDVLACDKVAVTHNINNLGKKRASNINNILGRLARVAWDSSIHLELKDVCPEHVNSADFNCVATE